MAFKMKGFSAFTKNGDDKKVVQDIVKPPAEQIKDYEKDIKMLLGKGVKPDDSRIKSMQNSINRLKQGKNN
jgi:hypothetical protein|tara:strand:- start:95 stop:307 length:213 start_codon:yes stop_codon:yes gene_type:complete